MNATHLLGAGAMLLGLGAAFAGSPYLAAQGRMDVQGLARAIASGEDHVTAAELADWIRSRKPNLRVIDIRDPDTFAAYAIPTAENVPFDRLAHSAFSKIDTIVLYAEGGAPAGQAWVLLRALGLTSVFFIAGGMTEWREEILAPQLPADANETEKRAFEARAELSRYFGGEPQMGPPGNARQAEPAPAPSIVRRRGC